MNDRLIVRGAREHNLRNVSLDLPRDALVVFTGLSGSGKSSLAFDTIFAEGQRRYVESLSAYARQFLGQMDKPDVDFIEGLSPAVSIDQKSTSRNPRSTVGTITEVYDYLRLLYARAGRPHCPKCGRPIARQTPQQIVDRILELEEGVRFQVLAPLVRGRKGEYQELFADLQTKGFSRVRVDGGVYRLADDGGGDGPPKLDKQKKHTIEVVVDRLSARASAKRRLTDSIETALGLGGGLVDPRVRRPVAGGPGAGAHVLRAPRLPVRRSVLRRARAAQLLLQLALRRLPELHRASARRSRSTRSSSSRTPASPWPRARSTRGPAGTTPSTSGGCSPRCPRTSASGWTPRGSGCRRRRARPCSAAAARPRSTCATATATAASAATTPPSRA